MLTSMIYSHYKQTLLARNFPQNWSSHRLISLNLVFFQFMSWETNNIESQSSGNCNTTWTSFFFSIFPQLLLLLRHPPASSALAIGSHSQCSFSPGASYWPRCHHSVLTLHLNFFFLNRASTTLLRNALLAVRVWRCTHSVWAPLVCLVPQGSINSL